MTRPQPNVRTGSEIALDLRIPFATWVTIRQLSNERWDRPEVTSLECPGLGRIENANEFLGMLNVQGLKFKRTGPNTSEVSKPSFISELPVSEVPYAADLRPLQILTVSAVETFRSFGSSSLRCSFSCTFPLYTFLTLLTN